MGFDLLRAADSPGLLRSSMQTELFPWTLGDADLRCRTPQGQNGRVQALGQVKKEKVGAVGEGSAAADVTLRVRGENDLKKEMHSDMGSSSFVEFPNLVNVSLTNSEVGDKSPAAQEGQEEEEAEHVCARALLDGSAKVWLESKTTTKSLTTTDITATSVYEHDVKYSSVIPVGLAVVGIGVGIVRAFPGAGGGLPRTHLVQLSHDSTDSWWKRWGTSLG